jgi:hypothetical protein
MCTPASCSAAQRRCLPEALTTGAEGGVAIAPTDGASSPTRPFPFPFPFGSAIKDG